MCRFYLLLFLIFTSSILSGQYNALKIKTAVADPAENSVLATGKWYKIKVTHRGIFRLSYEDLTGMGITNPDQVRIFGNGGAMLPLMNGDSRYDDLVENAIYMNKGSDGIFNQGDFILFYAEGPVTWRYNTSTQMFEHTLHEYSSASYYFITTEAGIAKKILPRAALSGSADLQVNEFDDYSYHEKNRINFIKSGRQWFGEKIDYASFDSTFTFSHLITSVPVKIKLNVVSRSAYVRYFTLAINNQVLGSIDLPACSLENKTGIYAYQKARIYSFSATSDAIPVKLTYNKTYGDDQGYLDYITVNVRRQLYLTSDGLFFRDKSIAGSGQIARYSVENCNSETEIWDITNPLDIVKVPASLAGNTLSFTDSTNVLKEYVAINPGAMIEKPEINSDLEDVGFIDNQNLHGISSQDLLIVTNPLFKEAADSIAEFHRYNDNLRVVVVTTDQIYNEFSSGAPDVSAVRDFARLIYNKGTGPENRLRYLLLVGDGSYNNASKAQGNSNFILTYQSQNSLNVEVSYVSDDFFGFMDDGEGGSASMENYHLELGVGRLPVKNADEAMALYRKIKNYNTYKNKGDWQNNILFAADDENGNMHLNQANGLATWIDNNYPEFSIKKVFIDAYPQIVSTMGARYPDANRIICNNIEKGLLIFNYTGHGGELGLADEQILMREDLQNLRNPDHLPLFITATCEFSRFDDLTREDDGTILESTSAGEYSILNPNGGSIALLTTTRIVFSTENNELNEIFYQIALSRNTDGSHKTLGDMIRMTKNVLGSNRNKLNFILLGDPALKLAIPNQTVITDSVNHVAAYEPVDTLKAFSKIRITGHIEDDERNLMSSFNGIIYPSVYDKNKTITTLANDNDAPPVQFSTREDLLYKGKASVVNGRFTFEFMVPKDITYNYGNGRITYFSYNSTNDANGEYSNFLIGGTNRSAEPDLQGPEISLFLNDENFRNQGISSPKPVIFAKINDESGINTTGNGIGHDITGVIDGDELSPVVMNEYFQTELDVFTSGTLTYPMANLTEGMHTLKVKVWDIFNNSSEQLIEFKVVAGDRIIISKVSNYPNPARDHTTFAFEHNSSGEDLNVTIYIYDLEGRLVSSYSDHLTTTGFNTVLSQWDLKDMNGNLLKQGIYPYRIRIADSEGNFADSYQKLVIIR
jgi:hypothetical protein